MDKNYDDLMKQAFIASGIIAEDPIYDDFDPFKEDDGNSGVNELQFLDKFMDTTPREVENCIEKLNWVVKGLEEVYRTAEKEGDNPFIEVEYSDVISLYNKLSIMLLLYHDCVTLHREGKLLFNRDGVAIRTNMYCANMNEHAPAYKHSIDNGLIVKLWKEGLSINKIAKRVGCSPDTVKRRIWKMQPNIESN